MTEHCVEVWLKQYRQPKPPLYTLTRFRRWVSVDTFNELLSVEDPRSLIEDWRDSLDVSPRSLKVYVSRVNSFYKRHNVDVGQLQGGRRAFTQKPHKALSKDEIRHLIEVAGLREKALFWMLYSCGARIRSVLCLNVDRVNLGAEPPVEVRFYPQETKYNVDYHTFVSSDALQALKNYLEWRRKQGEKITKMSPLFVNKYRRRLSYHGAYRAMKDCVEKADIDYNPERERLANHSFRGAFQRQLQVAGVNQVFVEKMMGHSMNSTVGVYSRGVTVEDLRKEYASANWRLEGVDEERLRQLENGREEFAQILLEKEREISMMRRAFNAGANEVEELKARLKVFEDKQQEHEEWIKQGGLSQYYKKAEKPVDWSLEGRIRKTEETLEKLRVQLEKR